MKTLNITSVFLLILSFSLLIVKTYMGLDFTDELQYYGQILSLLNHDKLFAEDLFIQQFLYIFYLPFFKFFQWLNPDLNGLIVFSRYCLLFTIIISIFLIRKMLSSFNSPSKYFTCAFICILLADKIFAISYGSLALIISTLIIALYLSKNHFVFKNLVASFLCLILCFCHPWIGVCLTCIWVTLIFLDNEKGLMYFLGCFSVFASLIFGLLLHTSYLDLFDFIKAIKFSSQYNNGNILKITHDMQTLSLYWLLSSIISIFTHFKNIANLNLKHFLEHKLFPLLTSTISVSFILYFWNSFSLLQNYIFYYISILVSLNLSPTDPKINSLFLKIHWAGTFTGTILAITTSNGLEAFSQGVIMFSPFLLLLLVDQIKISTPFFARSGLIFTVFIILASATWAIRHPYRDQRLTNLTHELEFGSIFSGLKVSQTKKATMTWLSKSLSDLGIEDGESALVVGGHPWIYFGSSLKPRTPVTFMHFRAKPGAFKIIAEHISSSPPPDLIFIAEKPPAEIADSLHNLLQKNTHKTIELLPPHELQEDLFREISYKLESPLVIHRIIK